MVDNRQVEKLKEGTHSWNEWRRQHPDVQINIHGANLQGVSLQNVDLKNVNLSGANLQGVDLQGAVMIKSVLVAANLEGADLSNADLERANLRGANLQGAKLINANLKRATLKGVNLVEATLCDANLERADLRVSKGLQLDATFTKNAHFSSNADDPWSVLRRTYTGPKFTFVLLGLVAFALPYIAKIGFWSFVNRGQGYTQGVLETIKQRVQEQGFNDQTITALGLSTEKITSLSQCLSDVCEQRSVWQLLFGVDQNGLFWLLPVVLIVYNVLRGYLTYSVAPMRDEEERSGYSPAWKGGTWGPGYSGLFTMHKVVWSLGWFALAAFVYNAYHWLSLPIYLPT